MIVGYDAKRLFHNPTGLGYYSRTLVNSLHTEDPAFHAVLFDRRPIKNELTKHYFEDPRFQIRSLPKPSWYHRSINLNRAIRDSTCQLYHGLSNELPLIPLNCNIPTVVTIHDVLYKSFPQDFPLPDRWIYDLKTRSALNRADLIIAISEATKSELNHYFSIDPSKIKVVYQSYDPLFDQKVSDAELGALREHYQLPDQYLLYVGSITYRKNLIVILQALQLIPESRRNILVVAGKGNGYQQKISAHIAKFNLGRWVKFLPNLLRKEVRTLYAGAEALIYPSLGEGFGLPVLEGIAAHIPVITSDCSSLPEAGGDLAIYFDPKRPDDLAVKIERLDKKEYQQGTIARRTAHLKKFSSSKISKEYLEDVYKPLISS